MIYDDGVKTDDELRVEVCPRCENEDMSTNAEYCKICGLRLYNYCKGEVISDPNNQYPDRIEEHLNKSDARYCEKCGTETVFFEQGLLRTWEDIKSEKDANEFDPISDDNIPF